MAPAVRTRTAEQDSFPPAKIAGLRAMVATAEYHSPEDAALRILPAVSPLAVDAVSEVRPHGRVHTHCTIQGCASIALLGVCRVRCAVVQRLWWVALGVGCGMVLCRCGCGARVKHMSTSVSTCYTCA